MAIDLGTGISGITDWPLIMTFDSGFQNLGNNLQQFQQLQQQRAAQGVR